MLNSISISFTADIPIYQQVYEQIISQILNGEIAPNTMLPSIRTIAKELRISIITVKKAWDNLEKEGYIYTIVGRGTFVNDFSSLGITRKKQGILEDKIKEDIQYYKKFNVSQQELISLIKKLYDK